jgi:hypothetical protein
MHQCGKRFLESNGEAIRKMIINLKKIPIMYMTCDKSKGYRQTSFEKMMKSVDLEAEKMNGDITENYNIGVAQEYIKALSKYATPFLILEDDARIVGDINSFQYEYAVNKDVDALYLGTSIVGRIKNQTRIGVIAANCGNYLRVFNMLGFHAVLYFSDCYVRHCISTLTEYIIYPNGACDDLLAERMWMYNVLALKTPAFYQNDGRNDQMTLTKVEPILV